MHDPCALPERDPRRWPARHGCPVGRFGHLEVVHTSDMLNEVIAGAVRHQCGRRTAFMGASPTRLARARHYLYAMLLRPEYLSQELDRPLPTKDGGILRTIREAAIS
jgi:hypothetical protein